MQAQPRAGEPVCQTAGQMETWEVPVAPSDCTQMPRASRLSHAVRETAMCVTFMDTLRLSSPSSTGRLFCPCVVYLLGQDILRP